MLLPLPKEPCIICMHLTSLKCIMLSNFKFHKSVVVVVVIAVSRKRQNPLHILTSDTGKYKKVELRGGLTKFIC